MIRSCFIGSAISGADGESTGSTSTGFLLETQKGKTMTTYLQVIPGVNLTAALYSQTSTGKPRKITKKALRTLLADHPEWDFRVMTHPYSGQAINNRGCIEYDIELEVRDPFRDHDLVGVVSYRRDGTAVVR